MKINNKDIEEIIKSNLEGALVEAIDLKGGNHWQVNVVSDHFIGMSRVKQEQMIQKFLKNLLEDETIHALVVKTKTQKG